MSQQEMGRKQWQQVAYQGLFKVPQPPLMVSLSNHPLSAMTAGRQLHVGSNTERTISATLASRKAPSVCTYRWRGISRRCGSDGNPENMLKSLLGMTQPNLVRFFLALAVVGRNPRGSKRAQGPFTAEIRGCPATPDPAATPHLTPTSAATPTTRNAAVYTSVWRYLPRTGLPITKLPVNACCEQKSNRRTVSPGNHGHAGLQTTGQTLERLPSESCACPAPHNEVSQAWGK